MRRSLESKWRPYSRADTTRCRSCRTGNGRLGRVPVLEVAVASRCTWLGANVAGWNSKVGGRMGVMRTWLRVEHDWFVAVAA